MISSAQSGNNNNGTSTTERGGSEAIGLRLFRVNFTLAAAIASTAETPPIPDGIVATQRTGNWCQELPWQTPLPR
jgi:hypothetical protein